MRADTHGVTDRYYLGIIPGAEKHTAELPVLCHRKVLHSSPSGAHRSVRLHIKQHRKEQELHPHHEHQKRQHPMHEEHRIPHRELLPERNQPPEHSDRREHRPGGVEEREGVKAHLDVLRLQAEEEVPEEELRDPRDVGRVADLRLLPAVAGRDRDVRNPAPADVQPDQEVVAVAVALIDLGEREGLEGLYRDRRVAVLGVHHLPVARGDLGEEGEEGVAETPQGRHPLPVGLVDEAVALGVVGPAVDDRVEEVGEVGCVHLVVPGHHRGDIHPVLDRLEVAGGDRRPDAPVRVVVDCDEPRVAVGVVVDDRPGHVGRAVVDHIDLRDVVRDAVERLPDQVLLVVRRDHHGNPLPAIAGLCDRAPGPGDLQVVVGDENPGVERPAGQDRCDRLLPVGPKPALWVGSREDDVVARPELRKQPGDLGRVVPGIDDDELLRTEVPGGAKDRLERPAVALVGLMPDDDRPERLGDRDGVVLRAVVDDEHPIRVLLGADDGLCDVGLLVVGRHRDEGPDGPLRPRPAGELVNEKACVPAVVPMLDDPVGRPGRGRRGASPGGHRDPSRDILWIAGSGEGAAWTLSGQERGWGVAGCIMSMPECWVVGESPECDVPVECDGSREPELEHR